MDLNKLPRVSQRIYLRDLMPEFAVLEGEVADADRAWVQIRVATEGDNIRRSTLPATKQVNYVNPDYELAVAETVTGNLRERAKYEVFWTLEAVGNLTADDQPLFSTLPVRNMALMEFERAWNDLSMVVAGAIHLAVSQVNPAWSHD